MNSTIKEENDEDLTASMVPDEETTHQEDLKKEEVHVEPPVPVPCKIPQPKSIARVKSINMSFENRTLTPNLKWNNTASHTPKAAKQKDTRVFQEPLNRRKNSASPPKGSMNLRNFLTRFEDSESCTGNNSFESVNKRDDFHEKLTAKLGSKTKDDQNSPKNGMSWYQGNIYQNILSQNKNMAKMRTIKGQSGKEPYRNLSGFLNSEGHPNALN